MHDENQRQDRALGMLAKFLKIVDTRVRIHTKMLNNLNVALTQLQYKIMGTIYLSQYKSFTTYVLRDAGYAMTRLLSGLTAATQNIESVYAYLRIMNSHHLGHHNNACVSIKGTTEICPTGDRGKSKVGITTGD